MSPSLAELLAALPADLEEPADANQALQELVKDLARRPVPVGRLNRLWVLGGLPAKIALAYLAWWLRSRYAEAGRRERELNETHLRAALQLVGTMSYLRGAMMKVGQMLANYPDVVPAEFAAVLGRLYFEAPPMHFSLLRELVRNELGRDPEELFDEFETRAFAAASLGQVHRARLKGSGQRVAVKIQYPNIARTIRDDLRNLRAIVSPMRLNGDWDNVLEQFDDIRRMLDLETDYEQEAENMRVARLAFRPEDEVVVPRVYPELSTRRVLTMEYLEGPHLDRFLAADPPQEARDRHGHQIALASFRLSYGSRLLYADPQPGNYLFLADGRLGLIDFGCCHRYSDRDVEYMTEVERATDSGDEQAIRRALARAADMTPRQRAEEERMRLLRRWSDWVWEPLFHDGPFDFGAADYFRRGVEAYGEILRRRYVRSLPVNTWLGRMFFGIRAMLHHLKARVNVRAISQQETTVRREPLGRNGS